MTAAERLAATLATLRRMAEAMKDDIAEVQAELIRRVVADDPLAFALFFLPHHLRDEDGNLSLSSVHVEWIEAAKGWGLPSKPAEHRDAYVAPREMGKSTWFFLLLPMWAAATGKIKFAAAFADSATQAEGHLATFKKELDENAALRDVYPDLCSPAVRPRGAQVSDNRQLLVTRSGFVFAAKGIDAGTLGMKVGERRPDLLILDDVEPGEANYSGYQVEKRLGTLLDVVLPLNVRARVVLVGTVTMPGSIVHQLVAPEAMPEQPRWVKDEAFTVHHAKPFTEAGESAWPEKWPTDYLRGIEHTRSFAKNFLNEPMPTDGDYWVPSTFRYGTVPVARTILWVDPAVTTKRTSDYTGLAVVGYSPEARTCVVKAAVAVKETGSELRRRVLRMLEQHPEVTLVIVEGNQGGDVWLEVFHDLPVRVKIVSAGKASKEVRAAETLNHYERGRVLHERELPEAERQMCAFPKAPHDDLVDAIGGPVNLFLRPRSAPKKAGARSLAY